jgi:hypothetical protein
MRRATILRVLGGRRFKVSLQLAVKRLLEYDSDIVEVVQFGSSVYAPELSRDVDLLVITKRAREYRGYLDAVSPLEADVIVVEVGEAVGESLLRGVLGSFRILYGDGSYLAELAKRLGDPSFEGARASLGAALDYFELSKGAGDELVRDRHVRAAFDALFHAARLASMAYLSTEVGRWGYVRRRLEEPFRSIFSEFIETLHMKYSYNGEYPRENLEEEFKKWFKRVEDYVSALEAERRRRAARAASGTATVKPVEPATTLDDVFRELSEIKKILVSLDERLPARVLSFREFAEAVLEEYWRLGGGFVNLNRLRGAVCSRLLIPPQVFDVWFRDLLWAAAGRLSLHESRTEKGLSVHVLTTAKTPEELVWGG